MKNRPMTADLLRGFIGYQTTQAMRYQQAGLWEDAPLWCLLTQGVEQYGEQIAVLDEHHQLTYQALLNAADGIAHRLITDGMQVGERVVIQLSNTCRLPIALFATLRAGLVPILALPAHGLSEIKHLAQLGDAKAYISEEIQGAALANNLIANCQCLQQVYLFGEHGNHHSLNNIQLHSPLIAPTINPDHPALFLVSGGTTGLPKLIPRTHNDYLFNIRCCCQASEINERDVYLAVLPAAHNFTLGCPGFLGVLAKGGKVMFTQHAGPDHCFELIEQHQISATALVPSLAQLWTEATQWEASDLSSLRLIQVGGSKLAYTDALAIQKAFPNTLQQVFGMAEGLICCTRLGDHPEIIASRQGLPVCALDEIRVVDPQGYPVGEGEEGELLTRGPYTLRGYYRADEHNQRAFTLDGFYCSGDKVRMDSDQYLTVTGRIKDVVNRAGECIATDEIEEHLLAHPQIAQVAVVAVPDSYLGERIGVALISKDSTLTLQALRQFLKERNLASFKLPDELHIVSHLPKTAVGKIDKKAILGPNGTPWMLEIQTDYSLAT
ncbi:(2,3-dihydroxybenzoyl)adenylate synthase [Vibrio cholerae]|uniref:(2,3-dihydroxybenzoyl)adenylate synthase n=1 Tax=Vibrio cholerae TaxID=666 RepID=UPI0030170BCB